MLEITRIWKVFWRILEGFFRFFLIIMHFPHYQLTCQNASPHQNRFPTPERLPWPSATIQKALGPPSSSTWHIMGLARPTCPHQTANMRNYDFQNYAKIKLWMKKSKIAHSVGRAPEQVLVAAGSPSDRAGHPWRGVPGVGDFRLRTERCLPFPTNTQAFQTSATST